ncbi:MAG: hypothetical protein N2037_00305 [Acidimicrobiales bacterium]|nr:hypothetical protein [Acidimicrobiales bacterium]
MSSFSAASAFLLDGSDSDDGAAAAPVDATAVAGATGSGALDASGAAVAELAFVDFPVAFLANFFGSSGCLSRISPSRFAFARTRSA